MVQRLLITDVDNTLFSWIDYFAPSFRAMVHALSRETGIVEEELYPAFRMTYQREGSVEFRQAIQNNSLISQLGRDEQVRLVELGSLVFSRVMSKHLRPYSDVLNTLVRLREDGVRIVAVTNSDALQAMTRLKRMGMSKLLDGLVAWGSGDLRLDSPDKEYDSVLAAKARRDGFAWVEALPRDLIKPSSHAYRLVLERLAMSAEEAIEQENVWVIGDSVGKDLAPARSLGLQTVWASYGHEFDQKNFDTLLKITHWSESKIEEAYETTSLEPDNIVGKFSDLLGIIPLNQGTLF